MSDASPNKTPVELLLVDDDQSDIYLFKRALKACTTSHRLQIARHGEDALALLRCQGPFDDAVRPDLIILDLNMPRMDGYEVLEHVKADDDLKAIPIIVMSSSESDVDVIRSYGLQASAYVSKPMTPDAFARVIRSIEDHWFAVVRLPPRRTE